MFHDSRMTIRTGLPMMPVHAENHHPSMTSQNSVYRCFSRSGSIRQLLENGCPIDVENEILYLYPSTSRRDRASIYCHHGLFTCLRRFVRKVRPIPYWLKRAVLYLAGGNCIFQVQEIMGLYFIVMKNLDEFWNGSHKCFHHSRQYCYRIKARHPMSIVESAVSLSMIIFEF